MIESDEWDAAALEVRADKFDDGDRLWGMVTISALIKSRPLCAWHGTVILLPLKSVNEQFLNIFSVTRRNPQY